MAKETMSTLALSTFCENMAMMLAAGIQEEDALSLMSEDNATGVFHLTAGTLYDIMQTGESFASAVKASELFPKYAVEMVEAGQLAGRTEGVMRGLAAYYDTLDRLEKKLKSAVMYPAILLAVMAVILVVMVVQVLPIFTGVYESLAGSLAVSSYAYIGGAYTVGIVALVVVLILAVLLLGGSAIAKTQKGGAVFRNVFEKLPFTKVASARLAQAQFTTALATFIASGVDTDTAMDNASAMVHNKALEEKLKICCKEMHEEGKSLAQAIQKTKVYDPLYARMLVSGAHSGHLDQVLARLADIFTAEANSRMDKIIDSIEPALAAFLTISVGLTLLSVMLPLVGILSSIV